MGLVQALVLAKRTSRWIRKIDFCRRPERRLRGEIRAEVVEERDERLKRVVRATVRFSPNHHCGGTGALKKGSAFAPKPSKNAPPRLFDDVDPVVTSIAADRQLATIRKANSRPAQAASSSASRSSSRA
jgi:hypothetical protein